MLDIDHSSWLCRGIPTPSSADARALQSRPSVDFIRDRRSQFDVVPTPKQTAKPEDAARLDYPCCQRRLHFASLAPVFTHPVRHCNLYFTHSRPPNFAAIPLPVSALRRGDIFKKKLAKLVLYRSDAPVDCSCNRDPDGAGDVMPPGKSYWSKSLPVSGAVRCLVEEILDALSLVVLPLVSHIRRF